MHREREGGERVREVRIKSQGLEDIDSTCSRQGGTSCSISSYDSSMSVYSTLHLSLLNVILAPIVVLMIMHASIAFTFLTLLRFFQER